jgi:threonine aldolase
MARKWDFFSDNCSAAHPDILQSLLMVNDGCVESYGNDSCSVQAYELFERYFAKGCQVFFVVNCTAANTLAAKAVLQPDEVLLCSDCAHLYHFDGGAIDSLCGNPVIPVSTVNGKIVPSALASVLERVDHQGCLAKMLSLSQSTEYGTVYSLDELRVIKKMVKKRGMVLHMDGARVSNAASFLQVDFKRLCLEFDIITFGGVKNGGVFGDALVFLNPQLAESFRLIHKQNLQTVAKSRFIATQFVTLLTGELWRSSALKANQMARELSERLTSIPNVTVLYPVESNLVFVRFPVNVMSHIIKQYHLPVVDLQKGVVRLATHFNTEVGALIDFVNEITELLDFYA